MGIISLPRHRWGSSSFLFYIFKLRWVFISIIFVLLMWGVFFLLLRHQWNFDLIFLWSCLGKFKLEFCLGELTIFFKICFCFSVSIFFKSFYIFQKRAGRYCRPGQLAIGLIPSTVDENLCVFLYSFGLSEFFLRNATEMAKEKN